MREMSVAEQRYKAVLAGRRRGLATPSDARSLAGAMAVDQALAALNDRKAPLEQRMEAIARLSRIRGAYTEEEMVAERRDYDLQKHLSDSSRAQWDLSQRFGDESELEELRLACIHAFTAIAAGQYVIDLRVVTQIGTRNQRLRKAAVAAATDCPLHPRHYELIADQLSRLPNNMYTLRSVISWYGARDGVLDVVERWAKDADPTTRSEAAYCLAWLADTSIALRNLREDPDKSVRSSAASTLGHFGFATSEEAQALREALNDPEVAQEARTALKALGLQPLVKPGKLKLPPEYRSDPARRWWWEVLAGISQGLLAGDGAKIRLEDGIVRSGWLGPPPASDEAIAELEHRIGARLPPSFRDYLRVSNGWLLGPDAPDRWLGTGEIGWFRDLEPEYLRIWTEDLYSVSDEEYFVYGAAQDSVTMRREYLRSCLQVAENYDNYLFLLNPEVVTAEGEWEAWIFGSKLAGAIRYRSWKELVAAEADKLKARKD